MKTGQWAEQLACDALRARGLKEVSRNYRCAFGELDIVMTDAETLVFVEVRYRLDTRFGKPQETIGQRKQDRVVKTAYHYLQQGGRAARMPCRFDVVVVSGPSDRPQIEWIRGAFQA
jgi:putative endonuclease